MRKLLATMMLTIGLLTACNLPVAPTSGTTPDQIATRVSQLMTENPGATPNVMTATPSQGQATATNMPATATAPAATAAITPSPTVSAPTQAAPSPTTPPGDPKNSLGQPSWQETANTSKTFYLYENEGTHVSDNNGLLVLTGKLNNGWLGWSMTHSHPASNFYLEADFQTQACADSDRYGVVFRAPSDQAGYFFTFTCDGKFSLEARDFDANTDTTLIKLTSNGAIHAGPNQTNRLGVMANGSKISLYANGVLLQEITDTTFNPDKGYLGVQIAANHTAGFTVTLQEISLWNLP